MGYLIAGSTNLITLTLNEPVDSVTLEVTNAEHAVVALGTPELATDRLSASLSVQSDAAMAAGDELTLEWTVMLDGQVRLITEHYDVLAKEPVALCTLEQVKERIDIGDGDDARVQALIDAVLPKFCNRYGREFMPFSTAMRTFRVGIRYVNLKSYDLRSCSAVVLHPEANAPATLAANKDYALMPIGGDDITGTFTGVMLADAVDLSSQFAAAFGGDAQMTITGDWGIWGDVADVPADVRGAAIDTVLAWLDRPSADIAGIDSGEPRSGGVGPDKTWDIPWSAHQVMLQYARGPVVG